MKPSLYIALGFALGIAIGRVIWKTEPVEPGPGETRIIYRDRPSDLDPGEVTTPERIVVYRTRTDTVNVCLPLPPELQPRPVRDLPPMALPDALRRYQFLILPLLDGRPSVSVYARRTDILTYDPDTARRVDLSYAHPRPSWRLAPVSVAVGTVVPGAAYASAGVSVTRNRLTLSGGYGALRWQGETMHGVGVGVRWEPVRWAW